MRSKHSGEEIPQGQEMQKALIDEVKARTALLQAQTAEVNARIKSTYGRTN